MQGSHRRVTIAMVCLSSIALGLGVGAGVAGAGTAATTTELFETLTTITIPSVGNAVPYPSLVTVSGLTGYVTRVRVGFRVNHAFSADLDILLQAPDGTSVVLMSDAGGASALTNMDLKFDDCAARSVPASAQIVSGAYRPTNYGASADTFGAGLGPTANGLAALFGKPGSSLNGAWNLYVTDDTGGDSGNIDQGWVLLITTQPTAPTAPQLSCAGPDFDLDGIPDLVVGAGEGGGPHVRVLSGADGRELLSFFAYDAAFTGGVRVAACDIDGDGIPDLVTGAGPGGGPHVRVFRTSMFASSVTSTALPGPVGSFFAYDGGFTGGVFVGCADMNADGTPDIVTSPGAGGGPHVRVFDGKTAGVLMETFAYSPSFTGGVFVGP